MGQILTIENRSLDGGGYRHQDALILYESLMCTALGLALLMKGIQPRNFPFLNDGMFSARTEKEAETQESEANNLKKLFRRSHVAFDPHFLGYLEKITQNYRCHIDATSHKKQCFNCGKLGKTQACGKCDQVCQAYHWNE